MHELAICQALINRIHTLSQPYEGARLERIVLQVGPLSGVEPSLIQHAFPLAAAGSFAEGAILDIDISPIQILCKRCGLTATLVSTRMTCPECGAWQTDLLAGDELILQRLEFLPGPSH